MRKLVRIFALTALVCSVGAAGARADDSANSGPTFLFGASTSYVYDFNKPNGDPGLNADSYANLEQDESFNIDLVQIGIAGQRGKASYGATLDFGDLASAAGDDENGDVGLQTAWLSYAVTDAVSATAGRFGTPIGYEVLEPWGNAHITRSYGWEAQPINHDGLKIDAQAGPVSLMVGGVNSFTVSDPDGNDPTDEKGFIASLGGEVSDLLKLYAAGIYTQDDDADITMLNGIISGSAPMGDDASLDYIVEGNWRQDDQHHDSTIDLWNIEAYLEAKLGRLALGVRGDYTDDEQILTDFNTSLWSITTTAGWTLTDGLIARIEYRHDEADDPAFTDHNGAEDSLDTLQAQVLWTPEI
jgi:Putative beta-barrel porin-2, OmpL-like. bbp2